MARLSAHLKYYVTKRISEDAEWRNVKVILSGHDVRLFSCGRSLPLIPRSQEKANTRFKNSYGSLKLNQTSELVWNLCVDHSSQYSNPNTRHCLYGLDADLMMLGLLSHDPHFCLLREEVTFGRKSKKSSG